MGSARDGAVRRKWLALLLGALACSVALAPIAWAGDIRTMIPDEVPEAMCEANEWSCMDREAWTTHATIQDGVNAVEDMVISPDGSRLFVSATSNRGETHYDVLALAFDPATGAEVWRARYDGAISHMDGGTRIAVHPDGSRVFVAGTTARDLDSEGFVVNTAYLLLTYDAQTGALLWNATYDPAWDRGGTWDAVLAPDGSRLYIAGATWHAGTAWDQTVLAVDTADGGLVWDAFWNGPAGLGDVPLAVAVSPDGSRVFATGEANADGRGAYDYGTIALDAATGAILWSRTYDGANGGDRAFDIAVSPDGSHVAVTGFSERPAELGEFGTLEDDIATVAYDADTGAELWVERRAGDGLALAMAPDGSSVFVTGRTPRVEYITIAYDLATGHTQWSTIHKERTRFTEGGGHPSAIATSPDGTKVYVSGTFGESSGGRFDDDKADFLTLAYDALTGEKLGSVRYAQGVADARALVVAPDGSRLYVAGENQTHWNRWHRPERVDAAVVAYDLPMTRLTPLDRDHDDVPDQAENQTCGRPIVRETVNGSGGTLGRCATTLDYEPPEELEGSGPP